MIFGKALTKEIVRGRKTETRRPLKLAPTSDWIVRKDGTRRRRPAARVIQLDGVLYRACRYQPGRTYSVQTGRGRHGQHRILVTSVRREPVGAIDYPAARAEGFRTVDEFKVAWVRIHDAAWISREQIDLLDALDPADVPWEHFERFTISAPPAGIAPVTWVLLERFRQRHAATLVWVITFELIGDVPRLLAPAGDVAGDDADQPGERAAIPSSYTVQPARALSEARAALGRPLSLGSCAAGAPAGCGCRICQSVAPAQGTTIRIPEPEPVDEATLARFAKDADERGRAHRGWIDQKLITEKSSLEDQLAAALAVARKRGINVRDDVRVIQRRLDAICRRIADRDAA